ncbi:MAG: methyltransferase domain-containing protein [Synergistaceae bacterium]|jgi:tRNA1(Val) A37 N6-methylase TrmN6|nr:methyltransferase domain-containing protein [Synergistaceae bacterium]
MTRDEILRGRLKLWQPDEGPRVTMDTVLLAAYVRPRRRAPSAFIELGAAAGAVSFMLALRFPEKFSILGIEIQEDLEALARRNRLENGFGENVAFRRMDLRNHRTLPPESFDGLVVNPPYEEEGRGRKSPSEADFIARQSACCGLPDIFGAARWLLKTRGRFFAVFRAGRLAEFLALMIGGGIEPKRLRLVHPREGERANLFLVEGLKGGGPGLTVEPPLFVYDGAGNHTPDLLKAYEPEGLPCFQPKSRRVVK